MSLEECCECNREFLTEADDYVVIPRKGYALRCIKCYFKKLQTELYDLRNGNKGACPTCEPVGELNKKLQAENERLKSDLENERQRADEYFDKYDTLMDELGKERAEYNLDLIRLEKAEKTIEQALSQFDENYGMPESEAIYFRNRKIKCILEEAKELPTFSQCNYCKKRTETKTGDCVICGFSKPNKEQQ